MKLSAKTRYGLAALTFMDLQNKDVLTLQEISDHLNVSKLYLEQIFANLKDAKLVDSIKGPSGGYFLTSANCSIYNILSSLEPGLFEKTPPSTDHDPINAALCDHLYTPIDELMKKKLSSLKLRDISKEIN